MIDVNLKCHDKFRRLKAKIKQWSSINKTRKSNMNVIALEELSSMEKKIDDGSVSQADKENRINIIYEIEKLDSLDSMDLLQKAHIKWDVKGDENSKFFHGLINQKRRNQMINGLMMDGTWITDPKDRDNLERRVNLDEINEAIWDCGSSKAPGPDGYTFAFVKKLQGTIHKDLHEFVDYFFTYSTMPHGANSSFFTLIPKVNNPTCITDFCPISLIGIHYKIIAKILAKRLAKLIDKIISKEQSAFIAGRQILDGPLILTEIIEWYKIWKKKLLIFKVDFEKAFDSISWKFLDHILVQLGLVKNGVHGLKLALFLQELRSLLMEAPPRSLHNALADAVTKGLISGVTLNNSNINISHLFYADDVIITSEWNARELKNIIRVFHIFYLASGLKINIHKSNIYGIGVNDEDVSSMAHNVGCISGDLPFTYLGLPIGSNMNSIASWKMVIDRFQSRLSSWKANLLSFGGRLTLIKSVLGSLGIYYFSIYRAPQTVLHDLERIRSNFFWVVKVIKAFHGQEGGFDSYGCKFKGCGSRIRFWKDIWLGETPLCSRYNRLYRLDINKNYLIKDKIDNGNWNWNWSITNLGSRNFANFRDMLNEIGDVNIEVAEDTYYWSLGSNGVYTVKEARQIIDLRLSPRLIFKLLGTKCYLEKLISFCGECL
ncbi:putative RNA-directed DNA polymerase, eukaryota, reverse transcriptase zinc-binding domain protein [Tanacetum coccineum]